MRVLDVLLVLPSLERGGAERVAVNLMNGLVEDGARVSAVLVTDTGPLVHDLRGSVELIVLGHRRVRQALPRIVRLIRRRSPDVILATHTHVNLALCAARPLLPRRTRLVVREPTHALLDLDGRSNRSHRLAQWALYRRADLVLATSFPMRDDLRRLAGDRVALLANPVRVDEIRSSASQSRVERPMKGRRFVTVGRLDPQKSLPDLVAAFAAGSRTDDELVLVGDGPLRDRLVALARASGVADRIRLTGDLAAPWGEVAVADTFLLASRAEGMPNAVLESLAVGTPVIATDELRVLEELRSEAPPGAVTLVPRSALADFIRDYEPPQVRTPLRESLLPKRFEATTVTRDLRRMLLGLHGSTD
jgi:glycosyltransferase involved in cell wall biosynthesis